MEIILQNKYTNLLLPLDNTRDAGTLGLDKERHSEGERMDAEKIAGRRQRKAKTPSQGPVNGVGPRVEPKNSRGQQAAPCAQTGAKRRISGKAETELRVKKVFQMLVSGYGRQQILSYAAANWNLKTRQADELIGRANSRITERAEANYETEYATARERLLSLYRKACKVKSFKTGLQCLHELHVLARLGDRRAEGVNHAEKTTPISFITIKQNDEGCIVETEPAEPEALADAESRILQFPPRKVAGE
jgi:hypothetical protein